MEKHSLKILSADDGHIGVEMVRKDRLKTCCDRRIQLVLMDINMPTLSGHQAAAQIIDLVSRESVESFAQRGIPEHTAGRPPLIVALTAYDDDETQRKCLDAGMHSVL